MRRALAVFRAAGLDPVPSVSLLRSDNLRPAAWLAAERGVSLYISDQAIYEYGGVDVLLVEGLDVTRCRRSSPTLNETLT